LHAFVQGSLDSYFGSSLCCLNVLCALLFCLTLRSRRCKRFVSVVLSRCPCLRGLRLSLSSDLVLAFVRLLITCLSSLFIFSFSFFYELVTMCVVNALVKGEIEDRSIRGPVDGRSLV
jgi:hypothetical protein